MRDGEAKRAALLLHIISFLRSQGTSQRRAACEPRSHRARPLAPVADLPNAISHHLRHLGVVRADRNLQDDTASAV